MPVSEFGPVRVNHLVLFVSDLGRAVTFYEDVFGMTVVAREPRANAAFLRFPNGDNHHDLGLFGVGPVGPQPARRTGMYHFAVQVPFIESLAEMRKHLAEHGALMGESSHGATKSLYGVDPDGNEFEVMWMLPRDEWGKYGTSAPTEPLHLELEVERWRGVRTA